MYNSGDQDFTAQLTEIISKKPDLLYVPADFAEGSHHHEAGRELGAEFQIMGGDAMDNRDRQDRRDAVGFIHTTFPYDPSMTGMSDIAKSFTENWKKAPRQGSQRQRRSLGYDSYMLVANAIKVAEVHRARCHP